MRTRFSTTARATSRARRVDDGHGSTLLEFVVLFPVVLVTLFGITRLAIWYSDAHPYASVPAVRGEQLVLAFVCLAVALALTALVEGRWRRHERGSEVPASSRSRIRDDRGSTSLELVIIFPVILVMIFGLVQGALYYHARNVAAAAAREGLRADAAYQGSTEDGSTAAHQFLDANNASEILSGISVLPNRDATQAKVTVKGTAISIVPGMAGLPVSQSASGPVERETHP